jgi:hypothetical protein
MEGKFSWMVGDGRQMEWVVEERRGEERDLRRCRQNKNGGGGAGLGWREFV